ncbi:MAG: hypothetical protein ABI064_00605 [Acidobacteriaceae bacterium]
MDEVGSDHTDNTPVYSQRTIDSAGSLKGNLVLAAPGDLAMGGRTNPDGSFAISNYDHNEANGLGNAVLTAPIRWPDTKRLHSRWRKESKRSRVTSSSMTDCFSRTTFATSFTSVRSS